MVKNLFKEISNNKKLTDFKPKKGLSIYEINKST